MNKFYSLRIKRLVSISKILGIIAIANGLTGLSGWVFDSFFLRTILPGAINMRANTAIGIILLGIVLIFLPRKSLIITSVTTLVFVLGFLSFGEYLLNINLGIDELLFNEKDFFEQEVIPPGRMAMGTALCFIICSMIAFLLLRRKPLFKIAQSLSLLVFLISLTAFVAHLYGEGFYYGVGHNVQMAFHTSIAFICLSIGFILKFPEEGFVAIVSSRFIGSSFARVIFVISALLPAVLSGVIIFLLENQYAFSYSIIISACVAYSFLTMLLTYRHLKKINAIDAQRLELLNKVEEQNHKLTMLNEELKTTNADLAASNVEIACANEELLSNNEALELVNAKLQEANLEIQRLSEEALASRENEYKHLTESITDLFFAFDKNLCFTYYNKASEENSGMKAADVIGKSLYELFPKLKGTPPEQCYVEALRTGTYQSCTYKSHRDPNIIYEVNAYPSETGVAVFVKDISERIEMEEALLESERQYHILFDLIKDPVVLVDLVTGNIIEVNQVACKAYGYIYDEMLRQKYIDLSAEPDKTQHAIEQKNEYTPVIYHRRKDRDIFPVEVKRSYYSHKGESYLLVIVHDISERLQNEEDLRMQKEILQNIFDHLPVMIALFDKDGQFQMVNKEWENKLGWPVQDMLEKDMLEEFYPDPSIKTQVTQFMSLNNVGWKDFKVRTRLGKYLISSWANVKLSDGRSIGIGQDVSERRMAEARVKELQSRMEGIINSAMDAIITTDENQYIILFNQAAERMFEYQPAEIIGKHIDILIPRRFHSSHSKHIHEFGKSGKTNRDMGINMTIYGLRSNGKEFPIEASISQIRVEDYKYYTVILRDITLRKAAELQEKQLNDELMNQNQQLQQFGYITSHNLRAPVANILGLTQIFNTTNPSDPINGVVLENVRNVTLKLDNIIKDLNEILAYQKAINTSKEQINFEEVLEDIKIAIVNHIESSDAEIIADFSNAPQVYSVKSYINSIFQNMLTNAIKYKHPNRNPIITIHSTVVDERVCISFSDNGIGIDLAQNGEKLFGLYKRFHFHVEGKGLGLHLVKTQVEALHGKIEVESQPEKGTTFTIYLPKE